MKTTCLLVLGYHSLAVGLYLKCGQAATPTSQPQLIRNISLTSSDTFEEDERMPSEHVEYVKNHLSAERNPNIIIVVVTDIIGLFSTGGDNLAPGKKPLND